MKNGYPNFVAHEERLTGKFEIFKLDDEMQCYSCDHPVYGKLGYPFDVFNRHRHVFVEGETVEEVEKAIALKKHQRVHGIGDEGLISCPKCGYKYSPNYTLCDEYGDRGGIDEDFSDTIKCICGCKFTAKIKVSVSFDITTHD